MRKCGAEKHEQEQGSRLFSGDETIHPLMDVLCYG